MNRLRERDNEGRRLVRYVPRCVGRGRQRPVRPLHSVPDGGRQPAKTYAQLHASAIAFPEVHRTVKVLLGRFPLAPVAGADHGFLIDSLTIWFEFDTKYDK
jgi:hypothetical protein